MNIILFSPDEVERPQPLWDLRTIHLLKTLRRQPGDTFDAGIINGPRGKGTIVSIDANAMTLSFAWHETPLTPPPLHLIIGLPRPQTARDVLRDATTLGVASLHFVRTEKGEASYANSSLWSSGEWQRLLVAGASQAFCTHLPAVTHGDTLAASLKTLPANCIRLLLDNYEATESLATHSLLSPNDSSRAMCLALGSERGWSAAERDLFRAYGFSLAHLGARVLRTETAVVSVITLAKAKRGWL